MDLKINREMLAVSGSIYDGIQEQSVELDYILPDYCPDIFKLVKCCVSPSVLSWSINGDTLSYELLADIRILYCSENNSSVQCINQKLTYSKSLQLPSSAERPTVSIRAKSDHINCRAANQRRIDMRGAVSVKISVIGERGQDVICDIFGMNSQVKKLPVEFAAQKLCAFKTLSVSEDIELGTSNPAVISVIRVSAFPEITDKKIIANKLVVKGEIKICVLYTCESGIEKMNFPMQFSQIVDIDSLDDSFSCIVKADTVSCDITPSADSNGDTRILKCELRISLDCTAVKNLPAELVTDVYSTTYPCEFASSRLKMQSAPAEICESVRESITIENDAGSFDCIYDAWCNPKNINISSDKDEQCLVVSGMLEYSVMVKSENSIPAVLEKSGSFEHRIPVSGISDTAFTDIDILVNECDYNIDASGNITLKASMKIVGSICTVSYCEAVTEVNFDDSVKKIRDGDYALKLYYGTAGENVWEIAKRCSTSVKAIMEENDLENESLSENGMLLIPIV